MTDIWKEREKALENQYIHDQEKKKLEKLREEDRKQVVKEMCRNCCPKCGEKIEPMTFRGVPLDKCPGCGGVWLGPNDLRVLSSKDHRSWFQLWFDEEK